MNIPILDRVTNLQPIERLIGPPREMLIPLPHERVFLVPFLVALHAICLVLPVRDFINDALGHIVSISIFSGEKN